MKVNKELRELVNPLSQSTYSMTERKNIARQLIKEKSRIYRSWEFMKRNASFFALSTVPFLAPLGIYEIGKNVYAEVRPLTYNDVNGDGIDDAIVAFPVDGIGQAVLGFIDGNNCPKNKGIETKNGKYISFNVGLWQLNSFRTPLVEMYFAEGFDRNASTGVGALLKDNDNNGEIDLELYQWCDMGSGSRTFNDVVKK